MTMPDSHATCQGFRSPASLNAPMHLPVNFGSSASRSRASSLLLNPLKTMWSKTDASIGSTTMTTFGRSGKSEVPASVVARITQQKIVNQLRVPILEIPFFQPDGPEGRAGPGAGFARARRGVTAAPEPLHETALKPLAVTSFLP